MTDSRSPGEKFSSAYDLWQDGEGVPIHRGYYVEDLYTLEVGPWARFGVNGALINLAEQVTDDAWVLEIPPGSQGQPMRHMFEGQFYVLSGRAKVWSKDSSREPSSGDAGVCSRHRSTPSTSSSTAAGASPPGCSRSPVRPR